MTPNHAQITPWIERLKIGDNAAVRPLWQRYYYDILRHARGRLPRAADLDDEGIAASAFKSFCLAAQAGRFPELYDRYGLWSLLLEITNRKIADALQHRNARKRGGGWADLGAQALDSLAASEPTPEYVAEMIEELQALLDRLPDDKCRQIAILKMEGVEHQEIADRLECALRTVANKLELIRATFRDRMPS